MPRSRGSYGSFGSSADVIINFKSEPAQRATLTLVYFIWLFTYGSFTGLMLWTTRLSHPSSASISGENMIVLKYIVLGIAALPAGVVMDTWVKKTHVLLCSAVVSSVWISTLAIVTMIETSYPREYLKLYVGMLMTIAVVEAFISVVLPTLGGDQIEEPNDVRKFYYMFYLFQNVGELIARSVYLLISHVDDDSSLLHIGWPCVILISAFIYMILALVIFCSKWTREIPTHFGLITDNIKIVKEAFHRRKESNPGENILAPATFDRGGDCPDNQVTDLSRVLKFGVVLIFLLPVAFARTLPGIQKSCPGNILSDFQSLIVFSNGSYAETKAMIGPLIVNASVMISIPIIYILCNLLARRGYEPTFLDRFLVGHVVIIIANICSMIFINEESCTFGSIAIPYALAGVCKALIYVAGYEVTFVSAPRSMQAIAMGMYFFLNGVVYCIHLAVDDAVLYTLDLSKPNQLFSIAGIASPLIGMVILILAENKLTLGLRKYYETDSESEEVNTSHT